MGNSINHHLPNITFGDRHRLLRAIATCISATIALSFTLADRSLLPAIADGTPKPAPSPAINPIKPVNQGFKVSFNGKTFSLPWYRWKSGKIWRIGIADVPLMQSFGVELLDAKEFDSQPWRWFNNTSGRAAAKVIAPYRYLDVTGLAKVAGWQLQISGDNLQILAPVAQIQDIEVPARIEPNPAPQNPDPLALAPIPVTPQPQRFTIALDRPVPWKLSQEKGKSILTVWGNPIPAVAAKFTPQVPVLTATTVEGIEDTAPNPTPGAPPGVLPETSNLPQLKNIEDRSEITFNVPLGWQTQVITATNPNRLVVDIAPDAFKSLNIQWAKGIRWRQQYISLGQDKFAITWLEINPKQVQIKPIWSDPKSLVGTAALGKTSSLWQASAAINAGFFNRNLTVPLGVIRRDRQWLSSPILNRGAIAWNDQGEFEIAKAVWQETIRLDSGESLPIVQLNSGYIEAGFSRYTPAWGSTYTPLSNNETVLVVENNKITNRISGGIAGQNPIPIPSQGYLLTLRGASAIIPSTGVEIRLDTRISPATFNRYPHVIGAGPVLLQNRQIVLDGLSENFKERFTQETALRSAIATTTSGKILLVAAHNRAGGAGPTFQELARILQQMGATDALNLDGGSSTSLYLGGQLINRSPSTAARVHNAIGIFALPNR